MPNFQTIKLTEPRFPIEKEGFLFNYIATSKNNPKEKLIFVTYKNEKFFLQQIEREKDYLIKIDKLTKINSVAIIHKALNIYSKLVDAEITFSNITPKKDKKVKIYQELKEIDFFINREFKQKVQIEIGFGSGRHLLYQAKKNPDRLFIGLEIHKPSIEQVLNLIKLENIKNILIVDYDAREFLEVLPSNSVEKIFIHFPIPWDKKPHRRVISNEFLEEVLRVLEKNGKMELRTDSIKYYNYSSSLISKLKNVEITTKKNLNLEIRSKYEERWKRQNKDIFDIIIKNRLLSPKEEKITKLTFRESFNKKNIWENFINQTIREGDIFIHFEDIYKSEDILIIKISFGKNGIGEHKYIILEEKNYYFPTTTISIKSKQKIHKKIRKLLNERSDRSL